MFKTILQSSKTVEKDYVYDFAKPWVGNGLVTAERELDIWKKFKKKIKKISIRINKRNFICNLLIFYYTYKKFIDKIWRNHRKLIQSTFNVKILQTFLAVFQRNSILLTKTIENKLNGPEFEISPHIEFIAFSNICGNL